MNSADACALLAAVLADEGGLPPLERLRRRDWQVLAQVASASLVSPAFHAALARRGLLGSVPPAFADYLQSLRELNGRRNATFLDELRSVASSLNAHGIVPGALKGSAMLVAGFPGSRDERVLGDIDLHVEGANRARAADVLVRTGYRRVAGSAHADAFVHPGREAALDLHHELAGPERGREALARIAAALAAPWETVTLGDARIRVPAPTLHLAHRFVHDMIHDAGYARGWLSLRALHDAYRIARAGGPAIRWDILHVNLSAPPTSRAWQAYGRAIRHFFRADPGFDAGGARAWMWCLRFRSQQRWPWVYALSRDAFRAVRRVLPRRWLSEHGFPAAWGPDDNAGR